MEHNAERWYEQHSPHVSYAAPAAESEPEREDQMGADIEQIRELKIEKDFLPGKESGYSARCVDCDVSLVGSLELSHKLCIRCAYERLDA